MEGVEECRVVRVVVVSSGGGFGVSIGGALALFLVVVVGVVVAGRRGMLQRRQSRMRLRQEEVQIRRLGDDKQQRHPRGRCERVRRDSGDIGQCSAQRRSERKCDAKTSPDQRHGGSALGLVANVRCDGVRQLHIALAQTAHDPTCQECPEVCCRDPQRDAEDVADH